MAALKGYSLDFCLGNRFHQTPPKGTNTAVEFVADLQYHIRPYLKEPTCIIRTNSAALKISVKLASDPE
jgi:hypothetical protein